MEEMLKFFLGDELVNKDNAIEDDSLAEYDGTTAVDILTDTDNDWWRLELWRRKQNFRDL